jgi:hypothetical protein
MEIIETHCGSVVKECFLSLVYKIFTLSFPEIDSPIIVDFACEMYVQYLAAHVRTLLSLVKRINHTRDHG